MLFLRLLSRMLMFNTLSAIIITCNVIETLRDYQSKNVLSQHFITESNLIALLVIIFPNWKASAIVFTTRNNNLKKAKKIITYRNIVCYIIEILFEKPDRLCKFCSFRKTHPTGHLKTKRSTESEIFYNLKIPNRSYPQRSNFGSWKGQKGG